MTLYKYLISDRIDILERGLIRFTHPSALNDLSELRPAFSALLTENHVMKNIDLERIADKAYRSLPESLQRESNPLDFKDFALGMLNSEEGRRAIGIPLSILNSFAPGLRGEMYKTFDRLIGVLSLSEAWNSGPMWAHYADQHRGFVIGLDSCNGYFNRKRSESDEFYHLRQVVYKELASGPRSFEDVSDGTKVFLTKEESWSYEREWRMLASLSDAEMVLDIAGDPVHLFPLPADVIQHVIFGARASQDLKSKLLGILKSKSSLAHVETFQAVVDDDSGGLRLSPLN